MKQVQKILGAGEYIAEHVDSFHLLTAPIVQLLKKNRTGHNFCLSDAQEKSIEELRLAVARAPRLGIVDFSKELVVQTDAACFGCGMTLSQRDPETGKLEILRYGSKKFGLLDVLSESSYYKESLACIYSVAAFRYFIYNAPSVVIQSDMSSVVKALSKISDYTDMKMSRLAHRLRSIPARWRLIHVPGKSLPLADFLSREHDTPYRTAFSSKAREMMDNPIIPDSWKKPPISSLPQKTSFEK